MVKKIALTLILIVFVVVAALCVFVATFDADRYRPEIVGQLESFFGNKVAIDQLSLAWQNGIAMKIDGFRVYPGAETTGDPVLSVEGVSAALQLVPLLQKNIEVGSVVVVRPEFHMIQLPQGDFKLLGLDPQASSQDGAGGVRAGARGFALLVQQAEVIDGAVKITDNRSDPPVTVAATRIDLTVRNISLTQPMSFDARLALVSEQPNVEISGRVRMPFGAKPARLEGVKIRADLNDLELEAVNGAIGLLGDIALTTLPAGILTTNLDHIVLGSDPLRQLKSDIMLNDGRLTLPEIKSPFTAVNFEAIVVNNRADIKKFSGQFAGGTLEVRGSVENLADEPSAQIEIVASQIHLGQVMPDSAPTDPQFRGLLNFSIGGTMFLAQPTQTLAGKGNLSLADGIILNLNVLREVFDRLSVIPGLTSRLRGRLPADYQTRLDAQNTVLAPIDLPISVREGQIYFDRVFIASQDFKLAGTGRVGFDQRVHVDALLTIDPDLSAALVRSVNELDELSDGEGRLVIPVVMSGRLGKVRVFPDVTAVATRFAAAKAQKLLSDLLS